MNLLYIHLSDNSIVLEDIGQSFKAGGNCSKPGLEKLHTNLAVMVGLIGDIP